MFITSIYLFLLILTSKFYLSFFFLRVQPHIVNLHIDRPFLQLRKSHYIFIYYIFILSNQIGLRKIQKALGEIATTYYSVLQKISSFVKDLIIFYNILCLQS